MSLPPCSSHAPRPGAVRRFLLAGACVALAAPLLVATAHAEDEELPPTSRFFDEYDRDADGRVTKAEFPGSAEAFRMLDKDKSGAIEPAEQGLPANYRPRPGRPKADDGAGALPGMNDRRRVGGSYLERLKKRLAAMDSDGDGKITKAEYRGNPRLFERLDRNGDDVLDAEDIGGAQPNRGGKDDKAAAPKVLPPGLLRMDADKDGKLTEAEWSGPAEVFKRLDKNQDGVITPEDLARPDRQRGGRKITPEQVAKRFEKLDANGDGKLTEGEIPARLFERIDTDKDGSVSLEEMQAAMDRRMGRGNRDRANKDRPGMAEGDQRRRRGLTKGQLRRFDGDQDGKVTPDEFPGGEEQFKALDANGDGVLTADDLPAKDK